MKVTIEIDRPKDRTDLPWRVRFVSPKLPEPVEYRCSGTRERVERDAEKVRQRMKVTSESVVHIRL